MKKLRNIFRKPTAKQTSNKKTPVSSDIQIGLRDEKQQTGTMIGIFYILAISVAVGALFLIAFPEVGQMVVDAIKSTFNSIIS